MKKTIVEIIEKTSKNVLGKVNVNLYESVDEAQSMLGDVLVLKFVEEALVGRAKLAARVAIDKELDVQAHVDVAMKRATSEKPVAAGLQKKLAALTDSEKAALKQQLGW
jgi:hypothetical protein